jgi:hypothetical protein
MPLSQDDQDALRELGIDPTPLPMDHWVYQQATVFIVPNVADESETSEPPAPTSFRPRLARTPPNDEVYSSGILVGFPREESAQPEADEDN